MSLVRTVDELDPLEQLALISISYSRLDTYATCPAKYWYTYLEKLPRVFGPAAALGNIVHGVLEKTEELDLPEMLRTMEGEREIYDPDRLIPDELIETGEKLLVEYVDRHGDETEDVVAKEMHFNLVVGSAMITGYIDKVTRDTDGAMRVTDYKTGKHEIRHKPAEDLQLGAYALAVTKAYPGADVYAELYYLRSGKKKGHRFTPADLLLVEARMVTEVNRIIEDRFFKPCQNFLCNYCDFNNVCPIGKRVVGRR